jgi:Abnormal spindle-like microcephaly-assoc'd, ASPM-SPD-2-Hydin
MTSPGSMAFGNVQVGKNQTQALTLANSGASSLTISQISASGTGFAASGLTMPVTLAVGQSKSLNITFTPTSTGTSSGSLAIANNGSNPSVSVTLSGVGTSGGPAPEGTLTPNPATVNFGNVQTGKTLTISETLTNTGNGSVDISQAEVSGSGFSVTGFSVPVTLAVNQSTSFSITFAPKSAGSSSGNLSISSDGSNPTLNIGLAGTGSSSPPPNPGTVTANPTSLSFGSVQVGKDQSLSETLTNTGGANVTISQANVTGSGFNISGLTPPLVLTPGQSFTFSALFAPVAAGSSSGAISITSNASDPSLTIPVAGTGLASGQLSVVPTSINFGNVVVGTNSQQTGTLMATGASVTVSSVNLSNGQFTVSGLNFPVAIPAGQSVNFTVNFTPQTSSQASATASFASDASNSPIVQSLTGTGITAPQHQVDLSWTASTSQDIAGYNVYRGTKAGGPYTTKLNSSLDPNATYTDNTVTSGQTYYYVTTAVNTNNEESGYSNQVQAVIPSP